MFKRSLIIWLVLLCKFAPAQKTWYFTKGLLIKGLHHYGREALYSDTLAYLLYNQSLPKPAAGKQVGAGTDGPAITWKEVSADSANIFKTRRLGFGGYLYLTYTSLKEENVLLNIKGNSAVYFNGTLHTGDPYGAGWL